MILSNGQDGSGHSHVMHGGEGPPDNRGGGSWNNNTEWFEKYLFSNTKIDWDPRDVCWGLSKSTTQPLHELTNKAGRHVRTSMPIMARSLKPLIFV